MQSTITPAAVSVDSESTDFVVLKNNVSWRNGTAFDFRAFGAPVTFGNNLFSRIGPLPCGAINSNTLSPDPGFSKAAFDDDRPRTDSTLRNNGITVIGQLAIVLDGSPRVRGARIDRGTQAFQELLLDDFE
jgi:hypothetical protein